MNPSGCGGAHQLKEKMEEITSDNNRNISRYWS